MIRNRNLHRNLHRNLLAMLFFFLLTVGGIGCSETKDEFRGFKPVYFSLCNPYKAFGKLGLTVIEHFEGISEKAVYAVINEGKWQVLEVKITKENIKIQRVL